MNDANHGLYTREPLIEICAVPRELLGYYWPRVVEWIEEALQASVMHEMKALEVFEGIESGRYLLLVMRRAQSELCACAVLAKSVDPQDRPYLALICCAGDGVQEWLGLLVDTCKVLGYEFGASEIIVLGRPGWRPLLQPHGLRLRAVVMSLDIGDGHGQLQPE